MTHRIAPPSRNPAPGTKVRPCITCGTDFHSQGAHNRMCDHCRTTARDAMGYYGLAFSSGRAAVRKTAGNR